VTAFTFSAEQLRSAPPEVRRWMAGEIARALSGIDMPHHEPARGETRQTPPMALAACTLPEAMQLLELIGGDPTVMRLFFELARDSTVNYGHAALHVVRMADLLRNAGLAGEDRLLDGLATIDRAFRQVHGERAGSLFGFDEAGHVYLHETTRASIRQVWQELAGPQSFIPPHLGPSEDIAGHSTRPLSGADLPF
jgi:hypothetical protein